MIHRIVEDKVKSHSKKFCANQKGFSSMEYLLLVSGVVIVTTLLFLPLKEFLTNFDATGSVDTRIDALPDEIILDS